MRQIILIAVITVATFLVTPAVQAVTWHETGDTGSIPATAQVITGQPGQPITAITGTLSDSSDVDMYAILLQGGQIFAVDVDSGSVEDPMIFLFSSDGLGLFGRDNSNTSNFPIIPADYTPVTDTYYLAVSAWHNLPVSDEGFMYMVQGGDDDLSFTDAVDSPVTSWSNVINGIQRTSNGGTYVIELTGAMPVSTPDPNVIPEPLTFSSLAMAAALTTIFARRNRREPLS